MERSILATIAYYDIFDYPLTSFEVFSYLINFSSENASNNEQKRNSHIEISLGETVDLLEKSNFLKRHIDQKFGFYFIRKRENIIYKRLRRKKSIEEKWNKARKIFQIMQAVPFVRAILVSGSLAVGNCRNDSDIDLVIITKNGRIWTARTFVTLLTAFLRARRHDKKTKDRICLNHYITEKSLKIPYESLYNAQSYIHLINTYDNKSDRKLFYKLKKENIWINKFVKNYNPKKSVNIESLRSIKRKKVFRAVSLFFETILFGKCGDFLEKKLSEIQSLRIKKSPLYKKAGGRIVINDKQLEFHPCSKENYIISEFNKRMKNLGLYEFANQKDSGLNQ